MLKDKRKSKFTVQGARREDRMRGKKRGSGDGESGVNGEKDKHIEKTRERHLFDLCVALLNDT